MSIYHRDSNCVPTEKVQILAGFERTQEGVQDIQWLPVVRRRHDLLQDNEALSESLVEHEYMKRQDPGDERRFLLG